MPSTRFISAVPATSRPSVRCSAATSTRRPVDATRTGAGTTERQVASLPHRCYPSDHLAPGPPGPGEETARSTDEAGRPSSPRREHRGGDSNDAPHTEEVVVQGRGTRRVDDGHLRGL